MLTRRVIVIKISNVKYGSFFAFQFSADESKRLVTVLAKYVSAFQTSYRACFENTTDYSEP